MSDTSLNVRLGAKTAEFNKKLKQSAKQLRKLGNQFKSIGSSISRNFTMPFAIAGGASVKMALDFEKSLTKIQTLVGKTDAEIQAMETSILKMSGEVATAPVDLANGLFFLESAGLRGQNALETLETVARGSASGLGDMEALSIVAAAAQNAYGKETLSATDALDKFGVMVRTGMFDAQELSQVLGRQLGLAANLGISFDEVGALISTFTQTTGDATSATNGLSAIMMTFAKLDAEPTKQQAEALEAIGMTANEVKESLGEDGLNATLTLLQQKFNESGISMASFFGKSQALKGVLGVLGNQTEAYTSNLEAMEESQNFVADAFSTTAETDAFKLQQALTNLKTAGTQFGQALAPIVSFVADKITSLTQRFSELSDAQKINITRIAGIVAISGPLLTLVGKLILSFRSLQLFVAKYTIAQKLASAAMKIFNIVTRANPIGIIVTLIGGLVVAFQQLKGKTSENAVAFTNFFRKVHNGVVAFVNEVIKSINSIGKFIGIEIQPLQKVELAIADIKKESDETGDSISDLQTELNNLNIPKINLEPEVGGGDDSDDETDEEKKLREEKERAEKKSLENIRILKQQFGLLFIEDDDKRRVQELKNQMENELLQVANTKHAEEEKQLIRDKFGKKIKDLNDKIAKDSVVTFEDMIAKIQETANSVIGVISKITNALGGLFSAQDEKANILFENEKARRMEDYDNWYNTQLKKIEQTAITEEEKQALIEQLDEEAATRKIDLETQLDAKEKQIKTKQAKRDKAFNIMEAIMNTAAAVTKVIANPILATIVGALGAAQVATIASTPIPALAQGGLAFGETLSLVGDNPNASVDPEVIAPLSKLENMLGNRRQELFSKIRGNDIFLANDLALMNRVRFT